MRATLLVIYVVSLAVLSLGQTTSPITEIDHDSAHYMELARSLQRGEGFLTQTHWALNMSHEELPYADTYRAPLYPILIAAFSYLTGDLYTAAKLVCVLTGALIPLLVFLFAHRRFGLPVWLAVLGAAVALVNHHLLVSGTRALTETPYTAGVFGVLYLVTRRRPSLIWAGVLAGLTWLMRYQALLLVPVCLLALTGPGVRFRDWIWRSIKFVLVALVVISPWMVRSVQLTGSPFYTDLKYHMVSTYDPDMTVYQYFHGLKPAPEPLEYVRDNPGQTASHFMRGAWRIGKDFPRENSGNLLLFALGAVGWALVWRRREEQAVKRYTGQLTLYGFVTAAIVAFSFADHRHLTGLDPLVAIYAVIAVAVAWSVRSSKGGRHWVGPVALVLLVMGMVYEGYSGHHRLRMNQQTPVTHVQAVESHLRSKLRPGDAVMSRKPYFISYLLDHHAVSLPWSSDEDFRKLAERYNVRFAIVPERMFRYGEHPESFFTTGVMPGWIREVERYDEQQIRLYEIETRSFPHPDSRR